MCFLFPRDVFMRLEKEFCWPRFSRLRMLLTGYTITTADDQGNPRELHTDLALDAIDYTFYPEYKTKYEQKYNESVELADCKYFTTNLLELNQPIEKDYHDVDSFVIYICLEGEMQIETESGTETVQKGETILIPAAIENVQLKPSSANVKLLEVYIG